MLYSHLDISSERWEVQQRVAVARGDLNLSGSGCGRQFMMTEAAFGRVEAKYMERLADLWNSPEQWTTIPPQCLTAQFRALCLRVLARQGAAVEQPLAHPHRQFPFALFQLLETPEEASNMVTIPECRKDTWTLAMQEQHPDLRGDDFLATVTLHAHLQSTNISNIEAKHASVRRQLTARSVQTWALKMATASAEWLCQHIRRGKLSKLSGPSACPLPLQLLHCQQLRAVRARRLPKRQGPLSWRVSTSTLASDIISLLW